MLKCTIPTVGSAVIGAYERERINSLHGTNSTIVWIVENVLHLHFQWLIGNSGELERILVPFGRRAATQVTAVKSKNELIPAEGIAAGAFVPGEAQAFPRIANTFIETGYIMTLVLTASGIGNSEKNDHNQKSGKEYTAYRFHKYNLERLKYQMFAKDNFQPDKFSL